MTRRRRRANRARVRHVLPGVELLEALDEVLVEGESDLAAAQDLLLGRLAPEAVDDGFEEEVAPDAGLVGAVAPRAAEVRHEALRGAAPRRGVEEEAVHAMPHRHGALLGDERPGRRRELRGALTVVRPSGGSLSSLVEVS